jgi:Metal-dependent hydrolases of the beta-lactamase superfamily III
MITHNIISTGSKGNAVVINGNILIDCGVPFAALKPVHKDLRIVLLTHEHTDHFNGRTIKRLSREHPLLRFGCAEWLAGKLAELVPLRVIDVYKIGQEYIYGKFSVEPLPLVHNVPNCGYVISVGDYENPERILYATDTNTMSHVEAPNYDLYLLEANYCEDEIRERIRAKMEIGAYCYEHDVLHNHLSKQKADDWLYQNMGANSRYVYLHGHESVLKTG